MKTNLRLLSLIPAAAVVYGSIAGASGQSYSYSPNGNLLAVAVTNSAPSIVTAPMPALIESNSYATFTVVAGGAGLTYQWLSNGIPVAGAYGDSLLVASTVLAGTNLGNFSVVISNAFGAITSAPVALWPDANGNGIPDWWEMKYFAGLNQPASGDFDRDGVDNLDEYLEGTDPTNHSSFNPRLHVQASHGSVTISPNLPYFNLGQLVTLTAIPDAGQKFVSWSGAVSGTKSPISFFMNTNESVTADFGYPLAVALDATNLVWTTSGDALWFGEAEVSEDGVSAAQSGPIVSYYDGSSFVGDQTSLQTTLYVNQPEQLGFWWDVSSQPPDGVTFSINGTTVAALSGEMVPWQQIQTNLSAGVYALKWTYTKGPVNIPDGIPYSDAAWVDQVTLTALATPVAPTLSIQVAGGNAVLLSWPVPQAVFRLVQNSVLGANGWVGTTNAVNQVNGTNQVLVSPSLQGQFYRLVYP